MPSVPLGIAAPFAMAALAAVEQREVDLQTQLAHSMGAVLVGSLIAMLYVSFFLLAFLGSLSAHLPYPAQSLWRSLDAGLPLLATLSKGYSPNEVHGRPAIYFLLRLVLTITARTLGHVRLVCLLRYYFAIAHVRPPFFHSGRLTLFTPP